MHSSWMRRSRSERVGGKVWILASGSSTSKAGKRSRGAWGLASHCERLGCLYKSGETRRRTMKTKEGATTRVEEEGEGGEEIGRFGRKADDS